MRMELIPGAKSRLGYQRIEIITAAVDIELNASVLQVYHLCETEHGLTVIASKELLDDLKYYRLFMGLSHVVR